jgi:hypothetical protein
MTNRLAINKIFLIPAGISVLVILPIIFLGLHDSTDLYQHIQFASTFYHSILSGDYYPSWSGEENFGYGSVGLRFYPPLFQFLLGLSRVVTGNWLWAIFVVLLLFSVAGVLGVFLWAKEFVSEIEAAIAAAVFALMPYQLSQIYTSAFYAQFCAISILPFSFLFVTKICREGRLNYVVGLAISLSIAVLTNLPAAVIGCLSLLLYSTALLTRQNLRSSVIKLGFGIVLALAVTSFYWLRMYPELELFRNTQFWADQTFNWREHFLLTQPSKVVFGIWFNNHTLITTILLAICGLVGLSHSSRSKLRPVVILFFVAVFMMTPLSLPLWLYIPYLTEVQFPERWQIITSATGAIILAGGAPRFVASLRDHVSIKNPKLFLAVLTLIAVVTVFQQLLPRYYKNLIPAGGFNGWCENDINSLGFEFFWTLQAKKEAFAITDKIIAPGRSADITEWKPGERVFHISAGPAENIRVATLYYPRWQATVNGTPVELLPASDGAMLVPAPPNESEIRIWFQEAGYVEKANYISALIWLILFLSAAYFLIANFAKSRNNFVAAPYEK